MWWSLTCTYLVRVTLLSSHSIPSVGYSFLVFDATVEWHGFALCHGDAFALCQACNHLLDASPPYAHRIVAEGATPFFLPFSCNIIFDDLR